MEAMTELIQRSQSKNLNFFEFSSVSPGAYPLTEKPEDSGYEIGLLESTNTDMVGRGDNALFDHSELFQIYLQANTIKLCVFS